jgi:hypothetical protein
VAALCFAGNSSLQLQGCVFQFQIAFGKLKWQQISRQTFKKKIQAWDGTVQD